MYNVHMDISIISRIHNNADTVEELCDRVESSLREMDKSYEIILVNDFSSDESWEKITAMHKKDPHIKGINMTRSFGESASLQAAFDRAKGYMVFTLSPTLENYPEELPKFIELMEESDLDLVVGYRKYRFKGRRMAEFLSNVVNSVMNISSGHKFSDMTSPMRLIKSNVLQKTRIYGEHHKFLPALIAMYGGKFGEVEIRHDKPKSKSYQRPKNKLFQTILDILSVKFIVALSTPPFATTPIRIFGKIGFFFIALGGFLGLYLTYVKFFLGQNIGSRPALLLSVLFLIVGWLSLGLGLLGEMIVRIYFSGDKKITYHIKEILE